MYFKIFAFTLLAACCIAVTNAEVCTGCPTEHDVNDPEVRTKLTNVLATANSPHEVKRIISVQKQVVAGVKFIVKFENQAGKECNASWVEQMWISKEPQAYIHSVNVTHDGSITILVSSSPKEGSVYKLVDSEGNILCRVDSAILKAAMDVRRRWNARYNHTGNIIFSKPKSRLRTLFDEIGSLPRPNWSFVGINQNSENQGAEISLPVEATLSAPHLFVISGNALFPSNLVEEPTQDTVPKVHKPKAPYMRSISLLSESSSSITTYSETMSSLSSSHSELMPCTCCHDVDEGVPQGNYPIKLLQSEANQCVSYKITENALLEIALQSFKTCQCIDDGTETGLKYFGPWTLAISKSFLNDLKKVEVDWRKKAKLRGPLWPPEELYHVKSSRKDTCLREGIMRKKVSEVLEYIMDTNTDKFHSESPITVRLAWFMEKQLKNTELVNPVYDWNTVKVLEWIRNTLQLPQYQACFETNGIRGRHLVLLDAERLEQMGIRDFAHILKITSAIRQMFKTKREKNIWREVTEARYDPLTLHAMHNYRSVTKRVPIYEFFINHHFINRKIPHYSLFELRRPVWDIFPRNVRTAKPKLFFKQDFEEHPEEKKCYKIQAKW